MKFDKSFILVIFMCNFANGFRRVIELGLYFIFYHKLSLDPSEVTFLLSLMAFPWIIKIFLAIISDNITFCGSRRKSYLIINSFINILSITLLMLFGLHYGKYFIMSCIIISQISMVWCDTMSDALIAQASRDDLERGASVLNGVTIVGMSLGGIIACLYGGYIEMDDKNNTEDPNVYFFIYAILICILLLASIILSSRLEPPII